ncbi:hypothetical protein CSKR_200076 [Clonorchis sinensis]|uniref:Uncharacterized protein n=1 Tax=Clonorchis sinensis TaxID=79923 RepID=A0A8T1LZ56_CLOSI|nr:hypothetical protein CSKR_200076 [Clonorchis sinensis]
MDRSSAGSVANVTVMRSILSEAGSSSPCFSVSVPCSCEQSEGITHSEVDRDNHQKDSHGDISFVLEGTINCAVDLVQREDVLCGIHRLCRATD